MELARYFKQRDVCNMRELLHEDIAAASKSLQEFSTRQIFGRLTHIWERLLIRSVQVGLSSISTSLSMC